MKRGVFRFLCMVIGGSGGSLRAVIAPGVDAESNFHSGKSCVKLAPYDCDQEDLRMKLLFRQRFFSWFDSYDIYDEQGNTVFTVQGRLSWGHCLEIHDAAGNHIGTVKEEVFTFLPRFRLYLNEQFVGEIRKEFTFLKPSFKMDVNGWQIQGDFFEWDYEITDRTGRRVAALSKQLFNWTDTYVIDVENEADGVYALMVALAIDAAKCSESD